MTRSRARHAAAAAELTARNNDLAVHRLFNELLSEIFMSVALFTPWGTQDDGDINVLTSVCSLWRQIALSTPRLWTNVVWKYRQHTKQFPPTKLALRYERLSNYLSRSKSSQVTVFILLSNGPDAMRKQVWELVTPHFHRCSSLKLDLSENDMNALLPLPNQLLRLKRLDIIGAFQGQFNGAVFENCDIPTLQELFLFGPVRLHLQWPSWKISGIRLNLRLVCVCIDHLTLHPMLSFVEQCPNLTSLYLWVNNFSGPIPSGPVVTLSQLSLLEINITPRPLITRFIDAPLLQEIHFGVLSMGARESQFDAQNRIYPLLKALTLHGHRNPASTYEHVLSFCRANPTIEKLELLDCRYEVLDALLVEDSPEHYRVEPDSLGGIYESASTSETALLEPQQPLSTPDSNRLGPTSPTCLLPGLLKLRIEDWIKSGDTEIEQAMRVLLVHRPLLSISMHRSKLPQRDLKSLREEFGDRFSIEPFQGAIL